MKNDPYMREEERLGKFVQDTQADLAIERDHRKLERHKRKAYEQYKKSPYEIKHAFFCWVCQEDFVAPTYKVWIDYFGMGVYRSNCYNCGTLVYRMLTHTHLDPYHAWSNKTRMMRSTFSKDIIQPKEYGFKMLYGDPYEHFYNKFQKKMEDIDKHYAQYGLAGKSMTQEDEERDVEEELREIYL